MSLTLDRECLKPHLHISLPLSYLVWLRWHISRPKIGPACRAFNKHLCQYLRSLFSNVQEDMLTVITPFLTFSFKQLMLYKNINYSIINLRVIVLVKAFPLLVGQKYLFACFLFMGWNWDFELNRVVLLVRHLNYWSLKV